jgi:hypothetical protein
MKPNLPRAVLAGELVELNLSIWARAGACCDDLLFRLCLAYRRRQMLHRLGAPGFR